jgi:photosystem II stability/assembly factor-like uncharacterized protein
MKRSIPVRLTAANAFIIGYALLLILSLGALWRSTDRTHMYDRSEARYDNPQARDEYDRMRLADPKTGEIPRDIRARELAFAERLTRNTSWRAQSASIHASEWAFAGPVNAGGRAQSIGIDIANESNLVVATAQGGVWRSQDAGAHWSKSTAPDQMQNTFSLVQDHRVGRRNVWYCGTGELLSTTFRRASVVGLPRWRTLDVGDGIYKSTDSGISWQLLPSTFDTSRVTLDSAFDGVWNIVVDNSAQQSDVIYAAGYGAILRSSDGGGSWATVLGDRKNKSFCTDVAITSTGVLYAYLSTAGTGVPSTAGVWRSVDGISWTKITPTKWPSQTVRMKLAIAPSNENIVYVAGEAPRNATAHAIWKYTYVSGNGSGAGGTWQDRSASLPTSATPDLEQINTLGGYALTLAVHPLDPEMVYLGGTDLYRSSNGFADALAIDWIGGYNPTPSSGQSYPNHHPDNHCLAFSRINSERMYNCNDAGVFVTDSSRATTGEDPDHPVTWRDLNEGLQAAIIYVAAIDHATAGDSVIAGGFQDQGAWIGTPGTPWEQYTGGDGCYTAIADNKLAIYTSSQFATMYRLRFDPGLNLLSYSFISPRLVNPQFVAPWMLDPTDSKQMYVADSNVVWWNSNLDGIEETNTNYTNVNWTMLTKTTVLRNAVIGALAMSVVPEHQLYYGTSDGHVYMLTSPTAQPVELTSPLFPVNAFVSCIAVDPDNAQKLVVCFSNYHIRSLFATDDGGKTWRDVSGNLEQYPDGSGDGPSTRWVSIVHQKGQTIYLVGTSVGLYSTTKLDGNVQWQQESPLGLGHSIVEHLDVRQSDGFVAVATQGYGMWYGQVVADSVASVDGRPSSSEGVRTWPDPASSMLSFSYPSDGLVALRVLDASGRTVMNLQEVTTRSLDCSQLASGAYLLEIRSGSAIDRKRFVVRH